MLGNVESRQGGKAAAICQHQGNMLLLQGEFDVVFLRGVHMILTLCKVHSATFEALHFTGKGHIET